jgi:hypothetical protein
MTGFRAGDMFEMLPLKPDWRWWERALSWLTRGRWYPRKRYRITRVENSTLTLGKP